MEYICGFMIANLMIITAIAVGKASISRLIHPQNVSVSKVVICTLIIGIVVKLFMAWYVNRLNQTIASPALRAVRNDSLSDSLVTAVTLLGMLLVPFTALPLDGLLGILVSLFIFYTGAASFCETIVLLLGEGIDPVTEEHIRAVLSQYTLFKNIEMMTLHDYGPEEKVAFIKVTFRKSPDSLEAATILKQAEQRLGEELQLNATLYWDTAYCDTLEHAVWTGGYLHE